MENEDFDLPPTPALGETLKQQRAMQQQEALVAALRGQKVEETEDE